MNKGIYDLFSFPLQSEHPARISPRCIRKAMNFLCGLVDNHTRRMRVALCRGKNADA